MIIYERAAAYDEERAALAAEKDYLGISYKDLSICDLVQLSDSAAEAVVAGEIFDLQRGSLLAELPAQEDHLQMVRVMDHPGQYNQKQNQLAIYLKDYFDIDTEVMVSKLYIFETISDQDFAVVKDWLINPVVNREVTLDSADFAYASSEDTELETVTDFISLTEAELLDYIRDFSFELDDILYLQDYFRGEGRNPRLIELKILDAYWSDHCRHTTFNTVLDNITVRGAYKDLIDETLADYELARLDVYGASPRPRSLMDLTSINARQLKKQGLLSDVEESSEVNACSVHVDIEVDGVSRPYLLMFKNETHNHPTEIEPYGGAHTCIGGGIRDPLSGRSWVYQSMRITGAADPRKPYAGTLTNKLPQRYITNTALAGFSDYANQIGLNASFAQEYYHPGFEAKRMELGALLAAAPLENVTREEATAGDVILMLGAETGRDGVGAAVGSSSVQTAKSLEKAGAEVQKGNPYEERKIMRLFRRPEAARLIKTCNDFGAGGVSIAIGELADGLDIYLDRVALKYPGLSAYEVALSESQERMAVVIDRADLDEFTNYCNEEGVPFTAAAAVTDTKRMRMFWQDKCVVDLGRGLLDSGGPVKHMDAAIETEAQDLYAWADQSAESVLGSLNGASQRRLAGYFAGSIGRTNVLLQHGGRNKLTPELGMVGLIPVKGDSTKVSIMTHGYFPETGVKSPYHAAYAAVIDSVAKVVCLGGRFDEVRLSFQEYFPSIRQDPARMGLPAAALLGAFRAQSDLGIACIGGKDSMSGSFDEIDVPPTLVSFAVATGDLERVTTRALQEGESRLYLSKLPVAQDGTVDADVLQQTFRAVQDLVAGGNVLALSTISRQGLLHTLFEMSFGNDVTFTLEATDLYSYLPGSLLIQSRDELPADLFDPVGRTGTDLTVNGTKLEYEALKQAYEAGNEDIFFDPVRDEPAPLEVHDYLPLPVDEIKPNTLGSVLAGSRCLIPVLQGSTGEYDASDYMVRQGYETKQLVLRTGQLAADCERFAEAIGGADILFLPEGEYYGGQIGTAGRPLARVLEHEAVRAAADELRARGGVIAGVGAGFAALIEANYFGDLTDLLYFKDNPRNVYCDSMQDFYVVGHSPVTASMVPGNSYSAPVSGRMLQLVCTDLERLQERVDIISIDKVRYLPEGSGINSIASKDGSVYGETALFQRMDEGLFGNIELAGQPRHFEKQETGETV